jgi:hypothetical protein
MDITSLCCLAERQPPGDSNEVALKGAPCHTCGSVSMALHPPLALLQIVQDRRLLWDWGLKLEEIPGRGEEYTS